MEQITDLVTQVEDGYKNPLEGFIELKRINDVLASSLKQIQPSAIEDAENYSEKEFKAFGATVTKKNGAGRWDYTHIEDWTNAKQSLDALQESYKAAHKAKLKGQDITEEGVIVEPAKYTEGKSTISIKL